MYYGCVLMLMRCDGEEVLDDNEWAGWLQWMRNSFQKGTISEIWKQKESDKWFNPAFQQFINKETVATTNQ